MKVFKFGGASVKNAEAVKNVAGILRRYSDEQLVIVISAMDHTTNALENLVQAYLSSSENTQQILESVKTFHQEIIHLLFPDRQHQIYFKIDSIWAQLQEILSKKHHEDKNFHYDEIVSFGELLCTIIISDYLTKVGIGNKLICARDFIKTDKHYCDAKVDWEETQKKIDLVLKPLFKQDNIIVTQGFISSAADGTTTTLGREGSDYSAGILAYCLNSESVTIWKDVPGMLNADPKWFEDTVLLSQISYKEAIELSYYGASVIHPKTIKPLQNKKIPLSVRSFLNPDEEGTTIQEFDDYDCIVPSFIFKKNQVLLSISPRDFSFIAEKNLSEIFTVFAEEGVTINMMQNSAISFSVCIDNTNKIEKVIRRLRNTFEARYNNDLELITIRHYDQPTIQKLTENKTVFVEQKSRYTARYVVKK